MRWLAHKAANKAARRTALGATVRGDDGPHHAALARPHCHLASTQADPQGRQGTRGGGRGSPGRLPAPGITPPGSARGRPRPAQAACRLW